MFHDSSGQRHGTDVPHTSKLPSWRTESALNSGPVDQHSHVLKTDHNYASWLKLIEADNEQVVLFQAPTWLPQADTNKNTSLLPLSIPRAPILWCGEETGSSAGTSMDSEGGSHDPVSVNNVTRHLPDNRKCSRRFQYKASARKRIWPRHWETAWICYFYFPRSQLTRGQ